MVRRQKTDEATASDAADATGEMATVEIPESDLRNELDVLAALIAAGFVRWHTEAKRAFREEGMSVNGEPVLSDKAKLRLADVKDGAIKLSLGDRHVMLRPV